MISYSGLLFRATLYLLFYVHFDSVKPVLFNKLLIFGRNVKSCRDFLSNECEIKCKLVVFLLLFHLLFRLPF